MPFYDRTRLIEGAIHTLTETLTHEMIIASVAILLILMHFRSACVICLTLPLAVLVSFILMRLLKIPSNIMSLSGIAISIGILVDQAIVMVENATHHLTAHFGKKRVTGDIRELVIPACRTVGRPIFFSVMIILHLLHPRLCSGRPEGKTFHPLAFTKSFAMIGVAILSITLVPALIPTFIRGRLRSEDESWLVRSLINIYKPVLTWAMPRRNLVMWSFAVLLIVGAGLFPLDAIMGIRWHAAFMIVVAVTIFSTTLFIVGRHWQFLSLASLTALSLAAYNFPKIGTDYMPVLDEGSILDMPVTVPRASVTEVSRDLRARNALLREFPEVESIVGKAGRADTPTDPSPLEMVETVINLRPKPFWPKRKMNYESDALRQASIVLAAMESRGLLRKLKTDADRKSLIEPATMTAVTRLDATTRQLVRQRYREFDLDLGPRLVEEFTADLAHRWQGFGRLKRPAREAEIARVAREQSATFAPILASGANQEDITRLIQRIADKLAAAGCVEISPELLTLKRNPIQQAWDNLGAALGLETPTLFTAMYQAIQDRRDAQWRTLTKTLDYEVFDYTVSAYDWYCLEEIRNEAKKQGLWRKRPPENSPLLSGEGQGVRGRHGSATIMADASSGSPLTPALSRRERGTAIEPAAEQEELKNLRAELDGPFAKSLFLWQKTKPDLVQEMDSAVQMPGWGNIWTQPIINRIDMLATGVRTMIGVKVFGNDLDKIQAVSQEVAALLRQVPGAADVFPDQDVGKGYLEINIDRQKAARYGVNVGDVQDVIEVALGGKEITMTVEGRERFPVRVRYGRAWREDEEQVKNLLVNASGPMAAGVEDAMGASSGGVSSPAGGAGKAAGPGKAGKPVQIPLSAVAEVKIVEGPAMIKSENGMLRSYVQLNVRDRDIVGFVEEAQRIVAQKMSLPQGMYLQWSGEFENQVRARKTMQVVFPAVLLLIFVILYLTYNDFVDAVLMMMAVPEALVGGVLFLWLFGPYFTPPVHYSVAVQVGFIACFGMATETGIIMLVYLREAIEKRGGLEKIGSLDELRQAVIEGAVHRLRPKLLTEGVAIIALAPMLWNSGVGHEVISAMAAPVLGGLLIADEVVDMFIPVRFYWVRRYRWLKIHGGEAIYSYAQRFDGVQPGGLPGGVPAEQHAHGGRDGYRGEDRRQRGLDGPVQRDADQVGGASAHAMPMAPPSRQSTTASTRNCRRMLPERAPTAIRRPISRVRSVTETSMMFMMPTPPTTSEIAATHNNSPLISREVEARVLVISERSRTVKSSGSSGRRWCRWRSTSLICVMASSMRSAETTLA